MSKVSKLTTFCLQLMLVLVLFSGCSLERSVNTMQLDMRVMKRDVAKIKRDMEELNKKASLQFSGYKKDMNKSIIPFRGAFADLTFRVDELQQEIQRLGGQIEELRFELKRESEILSGIILEGVSERGDTTAKLQSEMTEFHLKEEAKEEEPPSSLLKEGKEVKEGEGVAKSGDEDANKLYNEAKSLLLDEGKLPESRGKFKLFLELYKTSEMAPNAQYWIGETYYEEKRFAEAIMEFDKVLKDYRNSNKVPDAILKQGLAFYELKDKDSYRLLLQKLIKEYPNSEAARIAKEKIGNSS